MTKSKDGEADEIQYRYSIDNTNTFTSKVKHLESKMCLLFTNTAHMVRKSFLKVI